MQEELIYQLLVQIDVRAPQASEKLVELERRVHGTEGAMESGLQAATEQTDSSLVKLGMAIGAANSRRV